MCSVHASAKPRTALYCATLLLLALLSSSLTHASDNLRLKSYDIVDPQMGIPAFQVLAPQGWQVSGGMTWNPNLANLVTANVAITPRDQQAGFYVHPAPQYISGQIQYQWPAGQLYLGMIVAPMPNSPTEFIQQLVLPQQRPGAQNVRLVSQQDMPSWANRIAAASGGQVQGYGSRARFAYRENGRNWEEDFYCVVLVAPGVNPVWLAERNLSVRAQAGKLDAMQPLASAFVNSFRMNPRWFARFNKTQRQWIAAQQQGIANAGALSDAISRSNDQFDRNLTQQWQQRQQAEERACREFSEYIRDSETYYDPNSETNVELPGGYEHAWRNNLGEYLLSNDAGFNPNAHDNLTWEEMRPLQ